MQPNDVIDNARRIVIKIGSALLTDEKTGTVKSEWLQSVAQDVSVLVQQGKQVAIVSSGAIALGRKSLGISYSDRPTAIALDMKQAAASVGQVLMSQAYADAFKSLNITTSLVLLTPRDTEDRRSHLNARATLETLLAHKIVPIINENDTVSTSEIRFGDNDRLAARVAQMIGADLLIQLSTTDGLYTADPRKDADAGHIPLVEVLTDDITAMAGDALPGLSTGGMKSKLEAARICLGAGVHMMIAKGTKSHPLSSLSQATIFKAGTQPGNARKRWIQGHVKPCGEIVIDDGAVKALQSGKSLLPAGVTDVKGNFDRGDAVNILNASGKALAVGLIAFSATDTRKIKGRQSAEIPEILGYSGRSELIHRDDLALQE